jgi:hypothetical protein
MIPGQHVLLELEVRDDGGIRRYPLKNLVTDQKNEYQTIDPVNIETGAFPG